MSTIKDTVPNVEKFVRRNLNGGVDHLIVFLDDHQPEIEEFLSASPYVTCISTRDDWRDDQRLQLLNSRQVHNATLAARVLSIFEWAEWVFHIDGDEVIRVDRPELLSLPREVAAVRLWPLEAVAPHPGADPTWFKPLLDGERLRRLADLGLIGHPYNHVFFRGHTKGKVGVRPSPDITLRMHSAFDGTGTTIPAVPFPGWSVLHYESTSVTEFARKWHAMISSGPPRDLPRHRHARFEKLEQLFSRHLPAEDLAAEIERLYQQVAVDDVAALREQGVLEHLDPDSWCSRTEGLPTNAKQALVGVIEAARRISRTSAWATGERA